MRKITFTNGATVPALGQGTWYMGDRADQRAREVAALQAGMDLGMTLIDTAEMYANGGAEAVVGEAIRERRDEVFLVSKVLPSNASRRGTVEACERSLKRMGVDVIDLYLLHWLGSYPLGETISAFESLIAAGKIGAWGVSNFDLREMEALMLAGGETCQTNQILYNLSRRGTEWDLLDWCADRGMPVMAYSPLEQGRLAGEPALAEIARRHSCSEMQVALAWTLRRDRILAIPKASDIGHVEQNRAAADLKLEDADLELLDSAFPPPTGKRSLELL